MSTPSSAILRIDSAVRYLKAVRDGLAGNPFNWRAVDAQHARPILQAFGIELVTITGARRMNHLLKRGAQPVGKIYFTAPISSHHDVYVVGVQTKTTSPEKG